MKRIDFAALACSWVFVILTTIMMLEGVQPYYIIPAFAAGIYMLIWFVEEKLDE